MSDAPKVSEQEPAPGSEPAAEAEVYPVLPLRSAVLFPRLLMPVNVGRPRSVAAVEEALKTEEKTLVLVLQKDEGEDEPGPEGLHALGCLGVLRRLDRRATDGNLQVMVQGLDRVRLDHVEQESPFLRYRVTRIPDPADEGPEVEALQRQMRDLASELAGLLEPASSVPMVQMLEAMGDPLQQVSAVASMIELEVEQLYGLLEADTRRAALEKIVEYLTHEVQVAGLQSEIKERTQKELSRQQREHLLRQQLRAIQTELGGAGSPAEEVEALRERLAEAGLPDAVRGEVERELDRLAGRSAEAADYQLARSHIELVLELPWNEVTADVLDLEAARRVLDEDHFDLEQIKERIVEHLAVMKLNPGAKAPILCFAGPPGVGKTSLGQSIARALGRKFERISLGGLHDEAELRGHRRTYIGAMPGRIIQAVRRAGVRNPVLMLDEVDKLGRDFRGDPAAALMEILDPAQNKEFHDNYLDLPFDLSSVFFITTANALDTVPRPLLDRMEVLRLSGYSDEEKRQIARRYLIDRQRREAGLEEAQLALEDGALDAVIRDYTREAGVRELERTLGRICRKVAAKVVGGETGAVTVRAEDVAGLLGPARFRRERRRAEPSAGIAAGLAWTEAGGDVLYVEAVLLPDGQGLTLTGQLGDVMKESASAARSWIWSRAPELGIDKEPFKGSGVHIHVPAGAIPKDGPSAGVTMATALASLYSRLPARGDTAMTGEITLSGLVMPVGGIKEKILAAHRAGMARVLLPADNEADLQDLPEQVRSELELVLVRELQEVLLLAIPGLADRLVPTT